MCDCRAGIKLMCALKNVCKLYNFNTTFTEDRNYLTILSLIVLELLVLLTLLIMVICSGFLGNITQLLFDTIFNIYND